MIIVNRRFMAFDSIILILQTLGPFTVLVTVYFLVTELKEQNKVARANARQNIADSHQKLALAGMKKDIVAVKIKLRSSPKGTGIIAGGPVRAVCEVLGIKDIVAKSLGTANPHNVIRACIKALSKQNSPKNISTLRNKKISEIIEKRG